MTDLRFRPEKSKPDEEEKLPISSEEWVVFRDHDRMRVIKTTNSENGQAVFESIRQGKLLVSVFADGKVLGWLQPSAQQDSNQLGGSLCSPCYGIVDQEWIPNFLRTANISVQAETLEPKTILTNRGVGSIDAAEVSGNPAVATHLEVIAELKEAWESEVGSQRPEVGRSCRPRCCRDHTTAAFTQWIGGNESKRQLHSSPPSRPIQSWPVVVPK